MIDAIPALYPSVYPHHGWIVAAVAALGLGIAFRDRKLVDAEEEDEEAHAFAGASTNARIAAPARVSVEEEPARSDEAADEEAAEEVLRKRRQS